MNNAAMLRLILFIYINGVVLPCFIEDRLFCFPIS
jgi:hypothetical protein